MEKVAQETLELVSRLFLGGKAIEKAHCRVTNGLKFCGYKVHQNGFCARHQGMARI